RYIYLLFTHASTPILSTLSLHDALPIYLQHVFRMPLHGRISVVQPFLELRARRRPGECDIHVIESSADRPGDGPHLALQRLVHRSEEHTSELQSRVDLVCRLLLEKKKKK